MTEENDFYKIMWDQKARGEIIKHNNPLVAVKELADISILKDTLYNGVSIDEINGLVVMRSDTKVKSVFNATDGIKIQQNTGTVDAPVWTDKFFVDLNGVLNLVDIIASGSVIGGTISIGSGDSIFKVDTNGVYLGSAVFASAPFSVSMAGVLKATNATISGAISGSTITGGTITGTTIDGVTITGAEISATGALKVSSNVWQFNGTDFGVKFGGVVAGKVGPASIEYYQGVGSGDSFMVYNLPSPAWHNFFGNMTVNGNFQSSGQAAFLGGIQVRYTWSGSAPVNGDVDITHNFGHTPIYQIFNSGGRDVVVSVVVVSANVIKLRTQSATGAQFTGSVDFY